MEQPTTCTEHIYTISMQRTQKEIEINTGTTEVQKKNTQQNNMRDSFVNHAYYFLQTHGQIVINCAQLFLQTEWTRLQDGITRPGWWDRRLAGVVCDVTLTQINSNWLVMCWSSLENVPAEIANRPISLWDPCLPAFLLETSTSPQNSKKINSQTFSILRNSCSLLSIVVCSRAISSSPICCCAACAAFCACSYMAFVNQKWRERGWRTSVIVEEDIG